MALVTRPQYITHFNPIMKITGFALASLGVCSVGAFAPPASRYVDVAVSSSMRPTVACSGTVTEQETSICDVPEDISAVKLADMPRGGKILRDLELTAADGSTVKLGNKMGRGTSVVVFLRHLG